MHILYLAQYFNRPDEPGGGRAYHFAHQWAERGHRVTVITGTLNYKTATVPERYRGHLFVSETQGSISLIRCASTSRVRNSILGRILNFLAFSLLSTWAACFRVERPDLVYATSTPLTIGIPGWLSKVRWRCPFVFEVRDLWPESAVVAGILRNRLLIGMARLFEGFLYRRAARIVAVTRGIRDGIVARGIASEGVLLVPNGVDDLFLQIPDKENAPLPDEVATPFLCIYAGALGVWNGNETILEAALLLREHREISFLFIGDGDARPELERRASEHGLDSVRFLDPLPKEDIIVQIARAKACVLCTWNHPFHRMVLPNKLFDYMAAGKPVVAAAAGETADLLSEAQAGYSSPPGDARAMADNILALRALPEAERVAMGTRGRDYALAHFKRRDLADRVERMLREVVAGA